MWELNLKGGPIHTYIYIVLIEERFEEEMYLCG